MNPQKIAVVGAGTMGMGIAAVFAAKGHSVMLYSRGTATLDKARTHLANQGLTAEFTTDLAGCVAGADVVVETIAEDLDLKRRFLAEIESLVSPDCLLTTNTSSVPISAIATALAQPERLLGAHWFNPPEVMPLVEVIMGEATTEEVCTRTTKLIESLGKSSIVVRSDVPGFVINRLQYAIMREAIHLVDAGIASAEEVDLAVQTTLAPRWSSAGPLRLMDMAGLDVVDKVSGIVMHDLNSDPGVPAMVTRLVSEGALGTKTGRGFYTWTDAEADTARRDRDGTVRLLTERRIK